jgi:hypothetical protein
MTDPLIDDLSLTDTEYIGSLGKASSSTTEVEDLPTRVSR